jgi:hypothetical protein
LWAHRAYSRIPTRTVVSGLRTLDTAYFGLCETLRCHAVSPTRGIIGSIFGNSRVRSVVDTRTIARSRPTPLEQLPSRCFCTTGGNILGGYSRQPGRRKGRHHQGNGDFQTRTGGFYHLDGPTCGVFSSRRLPAPVLVTAEFTFSGISRFDKRDTPGGTPPERLSPEKTLRCLDGDGLEGTPHGDAISHVLRHPGAGQAQGSPPERLAPEKALRCFDGNGLEGMPKGDVLAPPRCCGPWSLFRQRPGLQAQGTPPEGQASDQALRCLRWNRPRRHRPTAPPSPTRFGSEE